MLQRLFLALFAATVIFPTAHSNEEQKTAQLKSMLDGNTGSQATVVVFMGISCPVSNKYIPRLNELVQQYKDKGVKFVGVNSNPGDSRYQVILHKKEYDVSYNVIKDVDYTIADYFHAERTPQAFLVDSTGETRYHGRIDDQHRVGTSTPDVNEPSLKTALDEVLSGKPVTTPETDSIGCIITRNYDEKEKPVTYSSQISRIIQNRCQQCHRPDGVAEFYSWMTYKDVKSMAGMIKEVVVDRRMPPWHADPHYGEFANDRSLSEEEINAVIAWVDTGMPMGDESELPPPKEYPKGRWTIGEPDMIVTLPEPYDVPADGVVEYKYFEVDPGFTEDVWIQKAEAIPDSQAVHHIILFAIYPGGDAKRGDNRIMIAGSAPGDLATVYDDGFAKKIPKGSKFLFEMHYTPIGKALKDQSYVGLVFAKEQVNTPVRIHPLAKQDFKIPPGDANYSEHKAFPIKDNLRAISFMPHMHFRGKSFKYELEYPDGKKEIILDVPKYDFNWQSVYRFKKPVAIPNGSTIHITATWDNSENNPYNPDPTKTVTYGEQTWEEMMFGFMDFYKE